MPRSTKSLPTPTETYLEGGLFSLMQVLAAMLIAARWLIPPEGAVFGETLWIVQLWIGSVLLWVWDAYRRNDYRLQWNALDAAVGLVVLGHIVSAVPVLRGQGDQRAALNLVWEWVGLGLSFFIVRQLLRTRKDCQHLIGILLAAAVMLGSYGIWQHYVELPNIVNRYDRVVQQLNGGAGSSNLTPAEARELQRELIELGVPQNPMSRTLWESRLRSTEPFATFALANTLAGFLAAWLLVGLDAMGLQTRLTKFRSTFAWRDVGVVVCYGLIAYCLVLTKSRTAWVGFLAGIVTWGGLRGVGSLQWAGRWLYAIFGMFIVGLLFFAVATFSGGFDRQVISEAPKSLEYRLQYWSGSWEVLKTHPLLGTGPGNFRQHYLQFKLPESSEEIADPHNWIFDLWANGGLLALLGFVAVVVLAGRTGWKHLSSEHPTKDNEAGSLGVSAWEVGAGLAFFVVPLVFWLSGESWEERHLGLFAGWAVVWWMTRKRLSSALPVRGIFAGGIALLIHLLGAGGVEMPGITQTFLLLVVILDWREWGPASNITTPIRPKPKLVFLMGLVGVVTFGLCLMTATRPVWFRSVAMARGDAALSLDRNFPTAVRFYEEAAVADPFSPNPPLRLAEAFYQRWQSAPNERDFERAVKFGEMAIERDPISSLGYRRLGQWYFERAQRQNSLADAKRAASYFSQAVERYPNSAPLRAELALAYQAAEQPSAAAEEAEKALALDQLNRDAGHRDKFLPEELLQKLTEILR